MTGMFIATALLTAFRPTWGVEPRAEEVPIEQLPPAVVDAVLSHFPGAVISETKREVDNGMLLYDIAFRIGEDRKAVKLTPAGSLVRVRR
ncbi:MAG TPA: hypothetical protein VM491_16135 [Burkholderiaceae bacterium]|jgi:hypothetical protein|nr:hypothetical protein [Burkholderiaceae bacterium]